MQRDQIAAPEAAEQHHRQREDVKQRQHADHALDRIALGPRGLAPDVIDRHRRGEIAVAEHRALGQPGGAAGILQQRDVIGVDVRPLRRAGCALHECLEGDDRRVIRDRRMRIANRAPMVVLADDQTIEQALFQELQRHRQQRREITGDENARAAVAQFMRQRAFAVERAEMHDAGAGLQRPEEVRGMIRRVPQKQRHRVVLAIAGAQEGRRRDLDHRFQLGVADGAVAEFDRRPRAVVRCGLRQQVGQRPARDRIVPMDPFRIKLFSGAPHQAAFAVCASDANVLPSAARRLSSGAGSSEGSLVSLA